MRLICMYVCIEVNRLVAVKLLTNRYNHNKSIKQPFGVRYALVRPIIIHILRPAGFVNHLLHTAVVNSLSRCSHIYVCVYNCIARTCTGTARTWLVSLFLSPIVRFFRVEFPPTFLHFFYAWYIFLYFFHAARKHRGKRIAALAVACETRGNWLGGGHGVTGLRDTSKGWKLHSSVSPPCLGPDAETVRARRRH